MLLLNNVLFPFAFAAAVVLPALNALEKEDDIKKNRVRLHGIEDKNGNERHLHEVHSTPNEKFSLLSRKKRANRCKPKSKCKKFGGSCDQLTCNPLDQREIKKGCRKPNKCKCCAPKCEAKSECSFVGGSCVEKKKACKATGGVILDGGCTGKKCYCCVSLPDCDFDLDPNFAIELPDLDVLLKCISFTDLFACLSPSGDFRPCLTKMLECNSELLPDGFPSDCIDDFIDEFQDDIQNLPDIGDLPQFPQQ